MGHSFFSSLRAKFLAVIVPLYVIVFILIFGVYEFLNFDTAREELNERMKRLASSQSIILAHPVAMKDTDHLGLMLASIISDPDLVGVTVFDDRGEVLDTFGATEAPKEFMHRVTINYADGETFRRAGELRLIMSTDRLLDDAKTGLAHSAGLAFALLLVIIVGSVVAYDRIVSKPLGYLLGAFRRTDADDLIAVDWNSKDELGRMIVEFNEMAHRLNSYKARVLADQSELERRVSERTRELSDAQERAETANKAKSRFLSSMSHELRTPLNAILGFGQLLQDSNKEVLSKRQAEHVADIMNGGRHLLLLIEEVLDLAKIEEGHVTLNIEPVNPASIVTECMTLTSALAASRNIKVTLDRDHEGLRMKGDLIRVKQVILNLISNAIKYNDDGGSVTIGAARVGHDRVRISVADNGPGIPLHRQPELFEPFSRLGAEATQTEGTGIGLTISKRLTEAMQGAIGFSSIEGAGSTFWIDLPAAASDGLISEVPTEEEESAAPALEASSKDVLSVLYIEDHPVNLRLMQKIVDQLDDTDLVVSPTGEEGIETAAKVRPDLILTDINLPGITGYDVLRELQSSAELGAIPVVALSADANEEAMARGIKAGFDDYLTKPIQVREILELFHKVRLGARKTDEAAR